MSYTASDRESAAERRRFEENLENFHSNTRGDDDLLTAEERAALAKARDEEVADLLAALDDLDSVETTTADFAMGHDSRAAYFAPTDAEVAEIRALRQPIVSGYVSKYDRAFARRMEIERDLAALPEHDHLTRATLERDLAEAKKVCALELERDGDETWRKRRGTDEWRTRNRDDYNASRRKVREEPNQRAPKAVLTTETEEERKARERAADAARKKAARANETPEQAAARKAKDAERKRRKRAARRAAKMTDEAQLM